ncbi:MAG: gliding motility lipoprotein GldH, partial [Dysgonomonas sp.]
FGSLYQSTIPLKNGIVFAEKRNVTVKILHGMQDEVLNGIEKVGVRLTAK